MRWDEIRRMQPDKWVLVEALRSRSEDGWWIIEDMALIQVFPHAAEAWEEYKALHKVESDRELCVLSTRWDGAKIEEMVWLGVHVWE